MSIKKSLAEAESDLQSAERLDEWAKWGLWISFGAPIFAMIGGLGDLFLSILIVSLLGALGCISVIWMNTTNIELAIKKRDRKKHLLKSTEREHERKEKQKIAQKELMEDRKKREETQLKEILELIEGDVDETVHTEKVTDIRSDSARERRKKDSEQDVSELSDLMKMKEQINQQKIARKTAVSDGELEIEKVKAQAQIESSKHNLESYKDAQAAESEKMLRMMEIMQGKKKKEEE